MQSLDIKKVKRNYRPYKKQQITLKEYYKTIHWVNFRKQLLNADDCECEICGRKRWSFYKIGAKKGQRKRTPELRFNIHHLHYKSLYKEKRSDVLVLCQFCHDLLHQLERASKLNPEVYESAYLIMKSNTKWEYQKR